MTKITTFILILFALSSFNSHAASHWSKILKEDLSYIRDAVKHNHPGYLDIQNPEFKSWFELGYQEALEQAEQVNSLQGLMTVTSEYIAGFADGHFGLSFNYSPKYLKWVGVKVKKIGSDYKVIYVDENHSAIMPPHLSKLVACDGVPVDEIMRNQLLKVRFNAPSLNFPKARFSEKLLLDDGIGKRVHFDACKFELNGQYHNVKLSWRSISAVNYLKRVAHTQLTREFKFEEMAKNHYWISLPTFQPNQDQTLQLNEILEQIKLKAPSAEQFVVDVRGNGGGNSEWGLAVTKAIYGEQFISEYQLSNPDTSYAEWRVSRDNLNYLKRILPKVKEQFGAYNALFIDLKNVTVGMENALNGAVSFVKQGNETNNSMIAEDVKAPAISKAKILFLTDGRCGSACLDFADLILKLPNVTHIGEETAADTVYIDIRVEHLPSGLGRFSLAQKVYRGRARGHNQSYQPDIVYSGDLANTRQIKRWVRNLMTTSLRYGES